MATTNKPSPEHERWLDEIVSFNEAATLRRVSVETIRRLVQRGDLNGVQLSSKKWGMTRREAMRSLRPDL